MTVRFSTVVSLVLILICVNTSFAVQTQNHESSANVSSSSIAIIGKVEVRVQSHGLAIEIPVTAPIVPQDSQLTSPDRLVFDFPGFQLQGANQHIPVNSGPVQEVRMALFQAHPPVTRVVVAANEALSFDVKREGNKVVVEIAFPKADSVPAGSMRQPTLVKKEHATSSDNSSTQTQRIATAPSAELRTSAYSLQDKARALRLQDLQGLEDKAAAGDPEAQTTLALAYHAAVLLKRNDEEALRLLHKAADQEYMAAQESLGIFSQTGIGTKQPAPAEALEWYKKAARQGSLGAATNIGLMYADGNGIPKDPAQAAIWFRQAAEGGDATAQYNLALMYGRGDGVSQDYKESVRWLTAAADQQLVPALMDLAAFYLHPPDGTVADVDRAIGYDEKAADLGSSRAQVILGNTFAHGVQGKPDYEQSVKWFRKAAEQGQRDGQLGLGLRYALGQGVPVDLEEACRLFTAAADQGLADAQYNLATMCEQGRGASADRSLAVHYYELAADQGMPWAQFRLGRLLASNEQSPSDHVSAYKWLMLAGNSIKESSPILSDLRKSMNQQEINEAEREVDNWRIAHPGYAQ